MPPVPPIENTRMAVNRYFLAYHGEPVRIPPIPAEATDYAARVAAQIDGASSVPNDIARMFDTRNPAERVHDYYRQQANDLDRSLTDGIADDRCTGVLTFLGPVVHSDTFEQIAQAGGMYPMMYRRTCSLDEITGNFDPLAPDDQIRPLHAAFRRWGLPDASPQAFAQADRSMQDYQHALLERARTLPRAAEPLPQAAEALPQTAGTPHVDESSDTSDTPPPTIDLPHEPGLLAPADDVRSQILEELFRRPAFERGEALERVVSTAGEVRRTRDTLNQAVYGLGPREMHIILTQLQSLTATRPEGAPRPT